MKVKVTQLGPTLCDLTDYTVHGILQAPSLRVDSLPAEPQGKPKNTGVGSQSIPSPVDLPDPGSPALQVDYLTN